MHPPRDVGRVVGCSVPDLSVNHPIPPANGGSAHTSTTSSYRPPRGQVHVDVHAPRRNLPKRNVRQQQRRVAVRVQRRVHLVAAADGTVVIAEHEDLPFQAAPRGARRSPSSSLGRCPRGRRPDHPDRPGRASASGSRRPSRRRRRTADRRSPARRCRPDADRPTPTRGCRRLAVRHLPGHRSQTVNGRRKLTINTNLVRNQQVSGSSPLAGSNRITNLQGLAEWAIAACVGTM